MQIHQLMDVCLFAVSFWAACEMRLDPRVAYHFHLNPVGSFDSFWWMYFILVPSAAVVMEAQGFYDRPMLCTRRTTSWQLFKGCSILTFELILALFLTQMIIARTVVIWFGVISFVVIFIKEELLRVGFKSKLAKEQYRRRFLLVGPAEDTAHMKAELTSRSEEGAEIVAELDLHDTPVETLVALVHEHAVNGVILSARRAYFEQVETAIAACELEGVEVWVIADFFKTQISRANFDDFYGRPVLVFRTTPEASWQSVLKSLLDLVLALVLLVVFSWLWIPLALLVKLTSRGPIFFRQKRAGLNGQPFTMFKFRTMVVNAEEIKQKLAAMNEMSGPVFKISKDPRVTPVGKLLRKFSADEIPQLFNVLRGEMSLVGPRPLPVEEVKRFHDVAHRRRLSVKPGVTGLWQVSGRSNMKDFADWVRLDLEYIDNWSLWLDFKILCRTVPIVLAGTGAQ
jgi:exopolysaccharide biosynthesis polyprenyl glycosylphosphotransferase